MESQRMKKRGRALGRIGRTGHGRDDDIGGSSAYGAWRDWRPGDRVAPLTPANSGRRGTIRRGPLRRNHDPLSPEIDVGIEWDDTPATAATWRRRYGVEVDVRTLRRLGDEEEIREAAQRERAAGQKAKAERRRLEAGERQMERALVPVLMHKRALLASGELRVDTSPQGVPAMACPTRHEKAVLVRVLWKQKPTLPPASPAALQALQALQARQPEPEPEPEAETGMERERADDEFEQAVLAARAGGAWPSLQGKALLGFAQEMEQRNDPCVRVHPPPASRSPPTAGLNALLLARRLR